MGCCAAKTPLSLFTADLTQELQCRLIGGEQRLLVVFGCQLMSLALGQDPVAGQIAVDPDNKEIVIFLPAHNQGSVTVQ